MALLVLALVVVGVQDLEEAEGVGLPSREGAALLQGGPGEELGRGLIAARGRQKGHLGPLLDI